MEPEIKHAEFKIEDEDMDVRGKDGNCWADCSRILYSNKLIYIHQNTYCKSPNPFASTAL